MLWRLTGQSRSHNINESGTIVKISSHCNIYSLDLAKPGFENTVRYWVPYAQFLDFGYDQLWGNRLNDTKKTHGNRNKQTASIWKRFEPVEVMEAGKRLNAEKRCLHGNHHFSSSFCCYLCSALFNYDSGYLTRMYFSIRLNCRRFGSVIYFLFFARSLSFLDILGVEDSSFLMKGIFFFLRGTNLASLEIELVQGFWFASIPSACGA